jgi:hypothetical protein
MKARKAATFTNPLLELIKAEACFLKEGTVFIALRGRRILNVLTTLRLMAVN